VTISLNNIEEAERCVMGFGTHVTAVRSNGLAERLRATREEFVQRYGASMDPNEVRKNLASG
jgi:hypothetical protein